MTRYTITIDFNEDADIKQFIATWLSKLMADAHITETDIQVGLAIGDKGIKLYPKEEPNA